jgi:hypothetical protein
MPAPKKKADVIKELSVAIITANYMTAGVEPIPETSCAPIPNITLPYTMDSV